MVPLSYWMALAFSRCAQREGHRELYQVRGSHRVEPRAWGPDTPGVMYRAFWALQVDIGTHGRSPTALGHSPTHLHLTYSSLAASSAP